VKEVITLIVLTWALFFTGKNTDKAKFFRSDSKILGTTGIFIENSNGGKKSLRSLHIAQVNPRRRYVCIHCIQIFMSLCSNIQQ
jgi:hypothetical protein